jgi:hypothetical protein
MNKKRQLLAISQLMKITQYKQEYWYNFNFRGVVAGVQVHELHISASITANTSPLIKGHTYILLFEESNLNSNEGFILVGKLLESLSLG